MTHAKPFKYKPQSIECTECGNEKHPSNFKDDCDICAECAQKERDLARKFKLNPPPNTFGCTVIQSNEEIAKAWATAMGTKRFTSLVFR